MRILVSQRLAMILSPTLTIVVICINTYIHIQANANTNTYIYIHIRILKEIRRLDHTGINTEVNPCTNANSNRIANTDKTSNTSVSTYVTLMFMPVQILVELPILFYTLTLVRILISRSMLYTKMW